jgi:hypothetical protein
VEKYHGYDAHVLLLQIHHYDVKMTFLGKYNHPLPSIGVITDTISHLLAVVSRKT